MITPDPKQVELAIQLLQLGVSRSGVAELLTYGTDVVERQLSYMPLRKAKRPEAFIVDAIRNDYSPPNPHYHAAHQNEARSTKSRLDEDAQSPP